MYPPHEDARGRRAGRRHILAECSILCIISYQLYDIYIYI